MEEFIRLKYSWFQVPIYKELAEYLGMKEGDRITSEQHLNMINQLQTHYVKHLDAVDEIKGLLDK